MLENTPFFWGAKGQKLTPEQVDRQRKLAEIAAARAGDTSPVGHWSAGAARVVDALGGVLKDKRADRAEAAGLAGADDYIANNDILSSLIGSGGSGASFGLPSGAQGAPLDATGGAITGFTPSASPDAASIREGLIQRGMPEHVADGFVMNFQSESGLNPGINEANPLVEGSRGGFGLAQWTGPRRKQLEAYAAQRGTPVSDTDTQLDFLMQELQGSEAGAAEAIFGAPDTGSAAAAIVNKFLRPAEEHRARRVAQYTGGQGYQTDASPQGGYSPQQNSSVIAALSGAMSDPWVAKKYGPVIEAMMGQQMKRGDMQFEQQLAQSDPMYQAKLNNLQNPEAKTQFVNGIGLINSATGEVINDFGGGADVGGAGLPAQVQELMWRAEQAGLQPGTPEYQSFVLNGGGDPATFRALDMQAKSAGLQPGTPEYEEFMASRGAGNVAGAAQTAKNEADIATGGAAAGAVDLGKASIAAGVSAWEDYAKLQTSVGNIGDAITAIDDGAQSGVVYKMLPNVTEASASLNNAMQRMGLDVIGSVTFGALSEGEMQLAMSTAVPQDLGPAELRNWLVKKQAAQQKASAMLADAAQYLTSPGNTINGWIAKNKASRQPSSAADPTPSNTPDARDMAPEMNEGVPMDPNMPPAPEGWDKETWPAIWAAMTPEDKELWK